MNSHFTHDAARAIHEARIAELKASAEEVRYQRRNRPLASLRRLFSTEHARIDRARTERTHKPVQAS